MRLEDFSDNLPGNLVPTIEDAVAFVPSALPDQTGLDRETVRLLASADNALGRLEGTTAREFNPYLIGSPLLHREAILSSRMEGTVTTPERLLLFQVGGEEVEEPHARGETQEVLNYVGAMQHGLDLLRELPPCLRLIREVHRVLLQGVRGERERPGSFRDEQNWIRGPIDDEIVNARYVPPPVPEMEQALAELEQYLNRPPSHDHDPLLIQLALVHYQFEAIHPFRDGNGRVGRLLIPLLLCSHGRLDSPLLYLSAFFERNRDLYLDLLLSVSQSGDFTPWLNFFLKGVQESAAEATSQALGLLELRQQYQRSVQTVRSSALLVTLIDRLFQAPVITISTAADLLGVSPQAAANNIRKLEGEGILRETTGRRRNQVFLADGIMAFMRDHPPTAAI